MRTSIVLTSLALLLIAAPVLARNPYASQVPPDAQRDWQELLDSELAAPVRSFADTVWLGGSGTGDGSVVRDGLWTFEAASAETPEFFFDGDPVGNEFRDGWTFRDQTTVSGPSPLGGGHWFYDPGSGDQVYAFDDDSGSFAHRATVHDNNGINDGPDPLDSGMGGSWSVWIGTNLYLSPEICGWHQTAGQGDGWSQGIWKMYSLNLTAGTPVDVSFYHRYAVEAGFDTCWVETSWDGVYWDQVGSAENPNGIFNDGDHQNPLPAPNGGQETVQLVSWPGGAHDLYVRFRVATDALYSDETQGGDQFYCWQLDDISLLVSGVPQDLADFESDMGGWHPDRFEGFDFDLTLEADRAAGRITPMSQLTCPIQASCPEDCGLEGNIMIFCDKDDCDLNDQFMNSYAASPPMSIGGPENPDIDGVTGRLVNMDVYYDGGTGLFETGIYVDWMYWPFDANHCPYTPATGAPGSGEVFNWSRLGGDTYYTFGNGATCVTGWLLDLSTNISAEADSLILFVGALSQCRGAPDCDPVDPGTPFFDNIRFGVYDPEGISIANRSFDQYADSFPLAEQAHQGLDPGTVRSDGAHNFPATLGIEIPLRYVRSDTAAVETLAPNAACFLRWKTVPGPCQDLGNAFWQSYPPYAWHEARMAVGEAQGTGEVTPGTYMTCFHASEANDGTSWGGEMIPIEPCDDILPDGVFSPGTQVFYFFEVRDENTGAIIGTTPSGRSFTAVDTTENFAHMWREFEVLPELLAPPAGGCDPTDPLDRANTFLVINDIPGVARTRMRAFFESFGLEYDMYDVVGTNWGNSYNGIGRREDRPTQQPRPPLNGATQAQLEPYDCIWYYSDWLDTGTLSDLLTFSFFGGQPTVDQQKLEGWLAGCTPGNNRLLLLDGYGWASDIDANTTHGPDFLLNLGVDVLEADYEQLASDLRRCARITGAAAAPDFEGQVWGTGCPDDWPADVLATVGSGELVANYVNSMEVGGDPVDCADDVNMPGWAAIIRNTAGSGGCKRSVAMSFGFARMQPLNCTDGCLYQDWTISSGNYPGQTMASSPAQMISDMFSWAGKPIGSPIAVPGAGQSPALSTRLIGARPNPANPNATIVFSLADQGPVSLKIFDVSGRLVRTLIEDKLEAAPEPYEIVWDGRSDQGRQLASGVFFYQLAAPGYTSAKKLVILK